MSDKERKLRAQMAATIVGGILSDPTSENLTCKEVVEIACDYIGLIFMELEVRELKSDK